MAAATWCLPDDEVACAPGGFTLLSTTPVPPSEPIVAPPEPPPGS